MVAVLGIGIFISVSFWESLHGNRESLSTTIRNLGLVIGGIIAILLAIWRSLVAQRQAVTARLSLLNERYERGAAMLGSDILSTRLAGIYTLQLLALSEPLQYHTQIMRLFCAFIVQASRNTDPSNYRCVSDELAHNEVIWAGPDSSLSLPADIQAAIEAILRRSKEGVDIERRVILRLGLSGANLRGARLMSADLSHAELTNADLSGAFLTEANLSDARLDGANLSNIDWWDADLSNTSFIRPSETGKEPKLKNRNPAIGLRQDDLVDAFAESERPPKIEGVFDAETGIPLVWNGKRVRKKSS